ncbi:MAG: hypothetical protein IJ659_08735 [Alloprevotella sp.]|nr:hypothetical protein [Alloprevotella sp.]
MKKILLAICTIAVSLPAMAQSFAKVDYAIQQNDFAKAITVLDEIIQNPKTTKFAEAYRKLGISHASIFNEELSKAAQGLPFDTAAFCSHLDKAVEALTKCHEADFTPDKKGKVKPQYQAENNLNLLQMLDYYNFAGMFMYQNRNEKASLEYFEKYLNLPKNPIFSQHQTDSIYAAGRANYSQAAFNCTLFSYNQKDWDAVLRNADEALKDTMNLHDLYIMKYTANLAKGDTLAYVETLKDGVARTSNAGFMGDLITHYMRQQDRTGAIKMADDLIAKSPEAKTSYYIKGCIEMNMTPYDYEAARNCFAKALEIDSEYLEANTNMGICYVNDITDRLNANEYHIPMGTDDASNKARRKIMQEKVYPWYNKALPYFEKVRGMAPERPELWAQGLYSCYYSLLMDEKASEIKAAYPEYCK